MTHFEFALIVLNPYLEYDSKLIFTVRATFMKESHHLSFENILLILGLTDLKTRRESGDFIQIYKIVHSLEK